VSRVKGFAGFLDPAEGGFDPGDRPLILKWIRARSR
jgi:hypothetical protein